MAIFHGLLRPRALDDAVHSGDNALNILLMVLLVAFGVASWYFHANPMAGHTGVGMAAISAAPTPGSGAGENAIRPSP